MSDRNLEETRRCLDDANRHQREFRRAIAKIHPENIKPTDFLEVQKMLTTFIETNEQIIKDYQTLIGMHQRLLDRVEAMQREQ